MTSNQFLERLKKETKEAGVQLRLYDRHIVNKSDSNTVPCTGYFCAGTPPTMAVCTASESWLGVAVHEYHHMQQWLEKHETFELEGDDEIDQWVCGKIDYRSAELNKYFENVIRCEEDCERRSLRYIKKHALPISPELYAQEANSYLFFLHAVKCCRLWYPPDKPPYICPILRKAMPKHLKHDHTKPYKLDLFVDFLRDNHILHKKIKKKK